MRALDERGRPRAVDVPEQDPLTPPRPGRRRRRSCVAPRRPRAAGATPVQAGVPRHRADARPAAAQGTAGRPAARSARPRAASALPGRPARRARPPACRPRRPGGPGRCCRPRRTRGAGEHAGEPGEGRAAAEVVHPGPGPAGHPARQRLLARAAGHRRTSCAAAPQQLDELRWRPDARARGDGGAGVDDDVGPPAGRAAARRRRAGRGAAVVARGQAVAGGRQRASRARSTSWTSSSTRWRTSSSEPGKSSLVAARTGRRPSAAPGPSGSGLWWYEVSTTTSSGARSATAVGERRAGRRGPPGRARGRSTAARQTSTSSTPGSSPAAAAPARAARAGHPAGAGGEPRAPPGRRAARHRRCRGGRPGRAVTAAARLRPVRRPPARSGATTGAARDLLGPGPRRGHEHRTRARAARRPRRRRRCRRRRRTPRARTPSGAARPRRSSPGAGLRQPQPSSGPCGQTMPRAQGPEHVLDRRVDRRRPRLGRQQPARDAALVRDHGRAGGPRRAGGRAPRGAPATARTRAGSPL